MSLNGLRSLKTKDLKKLADSYDIEEYIHQCDPTSANIVDYKKKVKAVNDELVKRRRDVEKKSHVHTPFAKLLT